MGSGLVAETAVMVGVVSFSTCSSVCSTACAWLEADGRVLVVAASLLVDRMAA